jgi:Methyltransferase FkbM domain
MEIVATTLDEFIDGGAPPPNFVKIDIEGSEGPALCGFSTTIDNSRPIFSIDLHSPEQDEAVGRFLSQRGYALYRYPSQQRNAIEQLTLVKDPNHGWPNPDGVWGTILAMP